MAIYELIKTEDETIKLTVTVIDGGCSYLLEGNNYFAQNFKIEQGSYESGYIEHIVLNRVLNLVEGYLTIKQIKQLVIKIEEINTIQ